MKMQDKLCDALTLVGLFAVIAAGAVSLMPERPAAPQKAEVVPDAVVTEAPPSETMEEVPMVQDSKQPEAELMPDSLIFDETDSASVARQAAADTLHTSESAEHTRAAHAEEGDSQAEKGHAKPLHEHTHDTETTGGEAAGE